MDMKIQEKDFIIFDKDEFESGNTLKNGDINNKIIGKINGGKFEILMDMFIQWKEGIIIEDESFDIFQDRRDRLQIIICKIEFSKIREHG